MQAGGQKARGIESNWHKEEWLTKRRCLEDDPIQRTVGGEEGMCNKFSYIKKCIALGSSEWPNMLTFALPISLASSKLDRDLRT